MSIENDTFDFQAATRMYYRPNGLSEIGKIIKDDYNFNKVYLIYGGHSFKNNGGYDTVIISLKENGIDYKEYSGIQANPDIEDVRKIVADAKVYQPDLILACGGGSVLDAAKSVAHGYYYDGDPLDFNKHIVMPLHALPLATVITLCASGSEMSDSCVISDRAHHFKSGFNTFTNYPLFSLLDPTLTYSVPKYQTAIGLADMFSHSMERYYSPSHDFEPADGFALSIMRDIVNVSKPVLENPESYEARRGMMLCGTLAHNGITGYGKKKYFIVHGAEHRLSGNYPDLLHGQGIALLLPEYLSINKNLYKDKIIRMGVEVFGLKASCTAKAAIDALKDWLDTLPLYHSFEELPFEVSKEDIEKAKKMLKVKNPAVK